MVINKKVMIEDNLKNWFWNKFNSCYCVKYNEYPQSIFMYYDKNFVRQLKLSRLIGQEIIYPTKVDGICLFELDYDSNYFFCSDSEIWLFFEKNYSPNYSYTKSFIRCLLMEYKKLEILSPTTNNKYRWESLVEETKLKILTYKYLKLNKCK